MSSPTPDADRKTTTEKKPTNHIGLRVINQDGNEVYFKIKRDTPLKKLMNAYCERMSVSHDSTRFLFNGERVQTEDTPESLQMEDGDVIDGVLAQTGGISNLSE